MAGLPALAFMVRHVAAGRPPLERARKLGSLLAGGANAVQEFDMTHCLLAGTLASRLGLGPEVAEALMQAFERWDGKGAPEGLEGSRSRPRCGWCS